MLPVYNFHVGVAGPDGSFVSTRALAWRYQVRIPVGPDICHCGCAYTVLQTVQRPGVYSAAYGTVHYKEPLKSFEIRVGHCPGCGLPSVAILSGLCRKRCKAKFTHPMSVYIRHDLSLPDRVNPYIRNHKYWPYLVIIIISGHFLYFM